MSSILLTACADKDFTDITVEMPESLAGNPVIDAYGPLKSYIDRTAHPDFKLGTGVEAGEYNKIGIVYRLVNENYDELTAGNHMKYNFCVNENGDMNSNRFRNLSKTPLQPVCLYTATLLCGTLSSRTSTSTDLSPTKRLRQATRTKWYTSACLIPTDGGPDSAS